MPNSDRLQIFLMVSMHLNWIFENNIIGPYGDLVLEKIPKSEEP